MIKKGHIQKRKKNLSKLKSRETISNINIIKKKNDRFSIEIVIVGRSNVGKSTLVNLLTHKKLKFGRRPGVTLKPYYVYLSDILITDLPGFGFMEGVSEKKIDSIKDEIVSYIELNKKRIKIAIHVIDIKSFCEIILRWQNRKEIPIDLELSSFLSEMEINHIIAINKIDKIKNDQKLKQLINEIKNLFKNYLLSLNSNYLTKVSFVSISSKMENISSLKESIRLELHKLKRDDLYKYF